MPTELRKLPKWLWQARTPQRASVGGVDALSKGEATAHSSPAVVMSEHRHGVCQTYQFFKRSRKFGFLRESPQFLNVGLALFTNTSKAKRNTSVCQQFAISAIFFSYELLLNSPLFCLFKGFFEIKCWTLCVSLLVSSCQFCLIVPAC